jgi:tetratricopeptide (TPR) repeat protein
MPVDWYRCTEWNQQSEAEFFRRLKRARRQGPQYLVIQAAALVGTGRVELAAAALKLIELFVTEHYEPTFASGAFHARGQALLMLQRWDEAFESFEEALTARRAMPNVIDNTWLEYPLAIARRRARDRYQRALDVLNEFVSPSALVLPIQEFQYFATLALISADKGDRQGASRWARNALSATTKQAPFSRHPDVGLVGTTNADLRVELEQLAFD